MYNFTGTDSIALPSSLGVSGKIPGIAYKIPDLEAFAQLTLAETTTGIMKACVQCTLSNGWSVRQTGVKWSTGGLALLALSSGIWQSLSPEALAPYRLLDLLYLYQSIATTGLLDVNYPSVYRAFVLNFAWAMGLFSSASVQQSIDNMRHLTGGNMADASGSAVGLVNRKLSPYNAPAESSTGTITNSLVANIREIPSNLAAATAGEVQTVTQASGNILQAGVPIYVNEMGIATADAFMTVFFSALIFMAAALGVLGLLYLAVLGMSRIGGKKQEQMAEMKFRFPTFARAWAVRLVSSEYSFGPIDH